MSNTSVDSILQDFRDEILSNVNAKECASELRRQHVIAESTETDIERARDVRTANGILFDHLRRQCTLEQIAVLSRVLMQADGGFGRTRDVGQQLHSKIQGTGAVAADQKVSPDESQLRIPSPVTPKAEADERRLEQEAEEKAKRELEEYLKKPTFAERVIETDITKQGFYKGEWTYSAEAVDVHVATGIKAKAKDYKSEGGAMEHARKNLKAILLEQGVIRKD